MNIGCVSAVIVLAVLVGSAPSQAPVPGSGKSQSRQPQGHTAATQPQPPTDQRGTEQSPVIVKVQPTPKTYEETAKEKAKEQEEASAKRWTLGLAVLTAVVAFLQLFMIGAQVYIATRQNKIIEGHSTIMDRQADAARQQAEFMRDGLTLTKQAAEAATVSAETADKSLRLLNRPWLDTADWRADANLGPAIRDGLGGYTQDLAGFTVSFNVVNSGPTPARLRYVSVEYTAVTDSNSSTGRVNPEAVSHVINPTGRYLYQVHIQGLLTTHNDQYLSREGFKVNIRGVIYFDDVFRKVDTRTIVPKPFQTDSTFSGREWHFGRNCILRQRASENEFIVPFGHEGVGVNDEDWDTEREQGQSKNQP